MRFVAAALALAIVSGACTSGDGCVGAACDAALGSDETRAEDATAIDGVVAHLEALADIAMASDGTRAAGTAGFDASADYVADRLQAAGYDVSKKAFTIAAFEVTGPGSLRIGNERFSEGEDMKSMLYSGSGVVSAPVASVAFKREAAGRTGPGCDTASFSDVGDGDIVLLRPGPCFFRDQAVNAQDAGAGAVVLSFPEYHPGGVLRPTLISPDAIHIPVVAASDELGLALDAADGRRVTLKVHAVTEERPTVNVTADSTSGDEDQVVIAGAHLDSVVDGPGINDNGSGVATLLAVAERMAGADLRNRIRFAFWSGEELGLLGSTHYVESLDNASRSDIAMYLNFDMLASPNYVRYVYSDQGAPARSEVITDLFERHFDALGLPTASLDLEGRSDHGPFARAGIPIGGLFSGADMVKTASEADIFGGQANRWEDPCYHKDCDVLQNLDLELLASMVEAVEAALVALTTTKDPLG